MSSNEKIGGIINGLGSRNFATRKKALEELKEIKSDSVPEDARKGIVAVLLNTFNFDREMRMQIDVIDQLERFGRSTDEHLLNKLTRQTFYGSEIVSIAAIHVIGKIGNENNVDDLIYSLKDTNYADIAQAAAHALGEIGGEKATEALAKMVSPMGSWKVVEASIKALEKIGTKEAIFGLLKGLKDADLSMQGTIPKVLADVAKKIGFERLRMVIDEYVGGNDIDSKTRLNISKAYMEVGKLLGKGKLLDRGILLDDKPRAPSGRKGLVRMGRAVQ